MFDAAGISLHPLRWQWTATKYSMHGLISAAWLFIAAVIAASLWYVSPYSLPGDLAVWAVWLPVQLAILVVQVSCLTLQITYTTMLATSVPVVNSEGQRLRWRQQIAEILATRDCHLLVVAYLGMCAGAYLLGHAPNMALLVGALIPLTASLAAFRGLLDSVRSAEPAAGRPALDDPAVGSAYLLPPSSFIRRYGRFWYDPAQLQTVATARAYASLVSQQRFNIIFVNASAMTLISLLTLIPLDSSGPLLVLRPALLISTCAVLPVAADRLARLRELGDLYIDRIAEMEDGL